MADSVLRGRILIGVGLAAVATVALAVGGVALWLLATVVSIGMLVEWGNLIGATRFRIVLAVTALAFGLVLALPTLWGPYRDTLAAIAGLALVVAAFGGGNGGLAAGLFYAGFPVIALLYLRGLPNGFVLALWTLAIVWATDIGAYFAGRAIGGPRLSPRISPNKTWAGLGGGGVAALVSGVVVASAGGLPAAFLWLGAPLAVVAQVGDLFESGLKRRAGAKDSGRSLGPHGGLLDRLDGAVPVLFLVGALAANGNLAV